jgi:decaprenylphospho-beta-D-erythro-pentofuranosid-2-ulose 2-reductase
VRDVLGDAQTVLVLGGGSDIGMAIARALVGRGTVSVVLAARDPGALSGAVADLEDRGARKVVAIPFDADDVAAHADVIERAVNEVGDLDVVILAFGVLGAESVGDDPMAAARLLQTNTVGATSALLTVANRLTAQGHGDIVVLSSVAGERVRRSNFVYGASKAGIDGLAQGLGDSLVGSGVRVLIVRPGFVHSKMTTGLKPAPMSTTPEAVAQAVVAGLRRNARVVWVPAQLRLVMAVLRHLPSAVFRRLPL